MKLLVNSDTTKYLSDEEYEMVYGEQYLQEMQDWYQQSILPICKEYSVAHEFKYSPEQKHHSFTLKSQKITLDEVAMNALFYDALMQFGFQIEYAALGGRGCEFSIEIVG